MVKIKEAIVVEGRYDKNTLSQIVDAPIFDAVEPEKLAKLVPVVAAYTAVMICGDIYDKSVPSAEAVIS